MSQVYLGAIGRKKLGDNVVLNHPGKGVGVGGILKPLATNNNNPDYGMAVMIR